jgi:hypothetical protein
MLRIASTLIALVASTRIAAASPDTSDERSPTTAVTLSAVPTALSIAAIGAGLASDNDDRKANLLIGGTLGLVIAPSIGQWYGSGTPLTAGAAIRYTGLGSVVLGLTVYAVGAFDSLATGSSRYDKAGAVFLYGGMAAIATGAVYDIATVHGRTVRANERRARRHHQVTPMMMSTNAQPTVGLGVVGTF